MVAPLAGALQQRATSSCTVLEQDQAGPPWPPFPHVQNGWGGEPSSGMERDW